MIPIITITNDTQIKTLMVQHGRPIDLLDPLVKVEPGRGFRTHCVWTTGNQAYAVTRHQGYEAPQDNGYVAIIVDMSDEEAAGAVITQFINSNVDPNGPSYGFTEKIKTEEN